jgi:hypothetical protein
MFVHVFIGLSDNQSDGLLLVIKESGLIERLVVGMDYVSDSSVRELRALSALIFKKLKGRRMRLRARVTINLTVENLPLRS